MTVLTLLLSGMPLIAVQGARADDLGLIGTDGVNSPTRGPWDQTTWTRYRDLDDTINEIHQLEKGFPDICRVYNLSDMFPYPNGSPRYSIEGRTIWGMKISDDPENNDSAEPEVLYVALTHAREWITNEVLMYFINYVLRNYQYNATISSLVNSTELWFIPVVNPDGFQESIDQDDFNNSYGVYGWRKNVNETNGIAGFQNYGSAQGDGTDLNRNMGYKWGLPGASSQPNDPTYRGASAFSEPETQMIHELSKGRDFRMAITYHSYSGLVLYPWGHTSSPPPDAGLLSKIALEMANINGYTPQQSVALYPTSGDFTDYMYGTYRIPAFCVEVNNRNVRFIPELSKVPEDCHLNREVSFLMAKLANDPYRVFKAGIDGHVKDIAGNYVPGANVNIVGMKRDINVTTAPNGTFKVNLEPGTYDINITASGGYTNLSVTVVTANKYRNVTYIVIEKVPPVISSVELSVDGAVTDSLEWRSIARISVEEASGEQGLAGYVDISRMSPDPPTMRLPLVQNGTIYEALWDTSGSASGHRYTIEAVLRDLSGNMDKDGSDPSGPDLIVNLNDTTAPELYSTNISGERNALGGFERGKEITFKAYMTGGGDYETGSGVEVTIMHSSGFEQTLDLDWFPVTDLFRADLDTSTLPLGSYNATFRAFDTFENTLTLPDTVFVLSDTTAPLFNFYIGNFETEAFKAGAVIDLILRPIPFEEGLTARVMVFDPQDALVANLSDPSFDPGVDSFLFSWDSKGAQTGTYHAEARLYDTSGNHLMDGMKEGYDVDFPVVDLTPPVVSKVEIDGAPVDGPGEHNLTESFKVAVFPEAQEPNLTCSLVWYLVASAEEGRVFLPPAGDGSFELMLNSTMLGGHGLYEMDIDLVDRFGNHDPDGLLPEVDVRVNLLRAPLSFISFSAYNMDHEEQWLAGQTEWVLQGESILFRCSVANFTPSDELRLMLNGRSSSLELDLDAWEGGLNASAILNTSMFEGRIEVYWHLAPESGAVLETAPFYTEVVAPKDEPVRDAKVTGWYRHDDESLVVNVSWDPPDDALYILAVISHQENGTRVTECPCPEFNPQIRNASFTVPWANITFLFIAVYQIFPEGSDRSMQNEAFLDLEGVSTVTFKAPKKPVVQEPPPEDDDGMDPLYIILPSAILLIMAAIIIILFIISKKRRDQDGSIEWEE